jgi:hypothetical protein
VVADPDAASSSTMRVVLENYSSDYEFEIPFGQWALIRADGGSPQAGDTVLVVFDDDGDAWVLMCAS